MYASILPGVRARAQEDEVPPSEPDPTGVKEILMHDGNCRPFTVRNRRPGRETNPIAWNLSDEGRRFYQSGSQPVTGWRIEGFLYGPDGIRNVGMFRPAVWHEAYPYMRDGTKQLGKASCLEMYRQSPGAVSTGGRFLDREHGSPHSQCSCGFRIVHDVRYLG
ncbi:UNVERIFIED_ORG: hypothetical protein J3D58_000449 [Paenarthrobacter nicotinovorans]